MQSLVKIVQLLQDIGFSVLDAEPIDAIVSFPSLLSGLGSFSVLDAEPIDAIIGKSIDRSLSYRFSVLDAEPIDAISDAVGI